MTRTAGRRRGPSGAHRRLPWLLALLLPLLLPAAPAGASTLPAGFATTLVARVPSPTALAFTPDGRGLVATQPGQLRVMLPDGSLLPAPALDLAADICTNAERGLLGVAVDPAFASNRWVYVFWTHQAGGTCPVSASTGAALNRVSRFTMVGDTADPGSELVVVGGILSLPAHNGGDIHFGTDGLLYVSVGDAMCQLTDRSRCFGDNGNSRRLDVPQGKVLRVTRAGAIPPGNPFVGVPGARRCASPTGAEPGDGPCLEAYATGFRNPFRFAVRPGSGEIYVNDVGQDLWEEVDRLARGADYGWNACEGDHRQGTTAPCELPGATAPLLEYSHDTGCSSITGGAFVPGTAFGADRQGSYLYADYVCGSIFERTADGRTRTLLSGLGSSSATSLTFGPYGAKQALYFLSYAGGGAVHRVVRTTGNSAPVAALSATGSDPATRTVRFDGSASYDPDGGDAVASYRWSFGDGSTRTTTVPTVSHRYAAAGAVTASLRVVDTRGRLSAPTTLRVVPDDAAPVVTITSSAPGRRFAVGDRPKLTATVTDAEDGPIPSATVQWTVLLHHNTHTHPRESKVGASIFPLFPPPEDLAATRSSYLEVRASATDADGVTTTATLDLRPHTVDLTFATDPAGRTVTVNGEPLVGPQTVTAWEGWRLNLDARDQPAAGGTAVCSGWSDGGDCSHQVMAPADATTYTAGFSR